MRGQHICLAAAGAMALAACNQEPPAPKPVETELPQDLSAPASVPDADVVGAAGIGTPMEERVATLGLLNKRNNLTQDLTMRPGESRRVGNVIVRLQACERTAPWEMPKETGAFVQVLVRGRGENADFERIFSGWLFKESPSLNVVEHPIYDVWVKDCAMSFPGGTAAPEAPASPQPAASPEPEPAPEAAEPESTAE